jgi:hypothetical protein
MTDEELIENIKSLRYFHSTPYFDTGLGCVVNGRRERNRIIKERGLLDVGDVNPNYIFDDVKPGNPVDSIPDEPDDEFIELWKQETEKSEQTGEEI